MIAWLTATDHKKIGILYIVSTLTFFVAAGILSMMIRAQLARPDNAADSPRISTTKSSRCTARR